MRRTLLLILILGLGLSGCRSNAPESFVGIQGEGPWTTLEVSATEQDFNFVIMSDRTGGVREGVFRSAVEKVNLLQPDFVMCVGDLITGYTTDEDLLNKQWDEFDAMVEQLDAPFFYVPGNHDYKNLVQAEVWAERYKKPYYHFIYKNVLMLCLNTEEKVTGETHLSPEQVDYFKNVLAENKDVRWTFVFLHEPLWLYEERGQTTGWEKMSDALGGREYTLFAGHFHNYAQYKRQGMDHIVLATTGGGSGLSGPFFGEFDHVVSVSVSGDEPVIANLMLDGIQGVDIRNEKTLTALKKVLETVRVQAEMAPIGPVADGTLNGTIKITNGSDFPLTFEFENNTVDLHLAQTTMMLNPGETGRIDLTLYVREPTPVDRIPLSKINWSAAFTPEGYGETDITGMLAISLDTKRTCPAAHSNIKIDGALDDWSELPYSVARKDRIRYSENWSGPGDCRLKFGVAQDADYLYIAVNVTDDEVGIDMTRKPFNKDSISVFLDARPEEERMDGLSAGTQFKTHMIFILSPGETPDSPDVYLEERLPEGALTACVQTENGYNAEIAIPRGCLDTMQNAPWESFRLNVTVKDPDTHGSSTLYWRPDWYGKSDSKDAGTFINSDQ